MVDERKSVAICVSASHTIPAAFLKHFMNFYLSNQEKYDLYFLCEVNYLIDYARNTMVKKLLGCDRQPDYFFFVDADMVFAHNTLDRLIEEDKDVITGLYFQRLRPHYPLAWKSDGNKYCWHTDFKENVVEEIDACGAGALLVKSDVFKKIGSLWFYDLIDVNGCPVGEDIYFCKKLQENGFRIWLHGGTIISHIGDSSINITDFVLCKNSPEYIPRKETGLHNDSFETKDIFMQ